MKTVIKQDGRDIIWSDDTSSVKVIFNNLTGRNFGGKEYEDYIRYMLHEFSDVINSGEIELWIDDKFEDKGTIKIRN